MSENTERKDIIKSIKEKGKSLEAEMSFFDHLSVLRVHLIRAALAILVFTGLAFYFYDFIWNDIIMGPKSANFWTYRKLCELEQMFPKTFKGMCITEIPGKIINTQMAGQFTLQFNSCFLVGIIFGFPYLLWELWRFIKPGLHEHERQSATGFIFYATLLFVLGILFGYFIVSALSINFLTNYTISSEIENTFTIDSYLSSVGTLTVGTGIIFELPIVIYILSKLGILTAKFMRNSRRYALVIILLIAAIVTPTPDIITMFTVALPLLLLYELSIFVASNVEKKRINKEKSVATT